jgi:hypothetical protein
MFKIEAELDATLLKQLVVDYFESKGLDIEPSNVIIEVKSTQNYKSEWEPAAFRAKVQRFEMP